MQVVVQAPVPTRNAVQFLVSGSPLQGSGTVRSCTRNGAQYVLGITFAVQLRVDPATTPVPGIEILEVFGPPGTAGLNVRK